MSTTPNMFLSLPTVSTTLGPAWASALNSALTLVDSHDHTSGNGARVPSSGLNIDADLSFGGNNATLLRSARFDPQASTLAAATDLRCLYAVAGNLYYNNASGTPVQITDGATLSATSLGGITGLPSGTASVAFATSTYTFNSATNTRATMDVGPVVIRETVAAALGITMKSPASLASAYELTLFSAVPGSTMFVRLNSAGVLACDVAPDGTTLEVSGATFRVKDSGISTAKIAALAVTRAKLEAVGQQLSSSGTNTTTSTTLTNLANLTVTLTSTGRPIMIMAVALDGGGGSGWTLLSTGAGSKFVRVAIDVTGSATATIGDVSLSLNGALQAGAMGAGWAPSALMHLYPAAAGTYTFQLQGCVSGAGVTLGWGGIKLTAWEL